MLTLSEERNFHLIFTQGNESFKQRKFLGTRVLGNESTSLPGSESSTYGTFAPGSESMWEQKFLLP